MSLAETTLNSIRSKLDQFSIKLDSINSMKCESRRESLDSGHSTVTPMNSTDDDESFGSNSRSLSIRTQSDSNSLTSEFDDFYNQDTENDVFDESSLSIDDDNDDFNVKDFMKRFVGKVFNDSRSLTLADKASFGTLIQTELGRRYFSLYVNEKRSDMYIPDEHTFYSLLQFISMGLFECGQHTDFDAGQTLLNMCFSYFTLNRHAMINVTEKQFIYQHISQLPIFTLRQFWTYAFQTAADQIRIHWSDDWMKIKDKKLLDETLTMQISLMVHVIYWMKELKLSKKFCFETLNHVHHLNKMQLNRLRKAIESQYK